MQAIEAMDERAYQVYVELPLLEQTKRYYKQRGVELIETESTPTFLEVADKAVDEEEARAQLLLQPATLQPLLEAVRCSLIQAQMDPLLRNEQSGLRDMLSKNRREDLRRVFRLFRLVEGGLDAVGAVIREHVEEHGAPACTPLPVRVPRADDAALAGHAVTEKRRSAISNRQIKDSASDPAFVQEVLALQTDILDLVADAMGGHPVILVAVHKGLETVANSVRAVGPCRAPTRSSRPRRPGHWQALHGGAAVLLLRPPAAGRGGEDFRQRARVPARARRAALWPPRRQGAPAVTCA